MAEVKKKYWRTLFSRVPRCCNKLMSSQSWLVMRTGGREHEEGGMKVGEGAESQNWFKAVIHIKLMD